MLYLEYLGCLAGWYAQAYCTVREFVQYTSLYVLLKHSSSHVLPFSCQLAKQKSPLGAIVVLFFREIERSLSAPVLAKPSQQA